MAMKPPPPQGTPAGPPAANAKPPPSPGVKKAQRVMILVGLAVLALVVAYTVGRVQTASHVTEAKRQVEQIDKSQKQTKGQLDSEKALVDQLEARRRLHMALLAMDQRNFGIADQHMQAAAKLLARSKPAAGTDLDKLRGEVASFKLVATEDLAGQRQKILDMVHRFDELVPPEKP